MLQSVPQDQKSVNSLHDVICITQLLPHFKHAAEVYLTLIFLCHNISDNVQYVVYLKNLSIKIDWSKKVQTSLFVIWRSYCIENSYCSIFTTVSRFSNF